MSSIPISQSTQRALDRFTEVLSSSLFTSILDERESDDFRLPAPDAWVQARLNLNRHWRALNIDSAIGVVHPAGDSNVVNDYSGSGEQYSRTQKTPYDVGIIVKAPAGFPNVSTQGRSMIDDEWMQRRVELYRGALLDVVPKHIPEPSSVHEIYIGNHQADLFELPDTGRFAHASVTFQVFQDVLINTW